MTAAAPATSLPPFKDLTAENITENVIRTNSQCQDLRSRYVFERLVCHLHDFARETQLSTQEWMTSLQFLASVDTREEFNLLSSILGLSLLVDSINNPKPPTSTVGTLLGPFHTHDAPSVESGSMIHHDAAGTPMLCLCTVKDTMGKPIAGCSIDVWETDSHGFYDVQQPGMRQIDGRAVLTTDAEGHFWFKGIVPVSYPIPHDGPLGALLTLLGRHPWRPAHVHFRFGKAGFDSLITALFIRGDPYEHSDVVFGVKEKLFVEINDADEGTCTRYNLVETSKVLRYDFVLASEKETEVLRIEKAREALEGLGQSMKFVNGLPVPDVD
ncbi:MAG: hypothetical protein M1828_001467 [Chrysothrix sp. TS-e1954]|nr:MAG: hypothetical protein M1828_001467 [Chrysothrix sp. TS-e1954]